MLRVPSSVWLLTLSVASTGAACSSAQRAARSPGPAEPTFTVVTYNVNYGLEGDPEVVEVIRRADADVVVLQETNVGWEAALSAGLADAYPHRYFHHAGAAGGSAILSRFPIEALDVVPPRVDGSWFAALTAVVHTNAGPLQLVNVHLRPAISDSGSVVAGYFGTSSVREAEMRAILATLDPRLPTLVAGDFNESGGGALAFLEGRGFEDGVAAFVPDADTWRWTTSVGQIESQLDHLAYDPRVEPLEVRVIAEGPSDHVPVFARLSLRRAKPS
ncbi:MAG: endonuclease/exonuclease/phosphatase family protein [Myxococcales bacterium]|nr:endonuclease/exonuclease/phosphatase family protein [Myxococcales bacterium]